MGAASDRLKPTLIAGRVPDYQMSAMLMAIYIRGMTEAETSYLTKAIFESGEMLDLSSLGLTVDKHSTVVHAIPCDRLQQWWQSLLTFQGGNDCRLHSACDMFCVEPHQIDVTIAPAQGGVGDKVSIALAPLVASLGIVVPMMSGRGLGHTGGTLDKLESVPGLRTDLTTEEFIQQLSEIGVAITGPTDTVAPVDRCPFFQTIRVVRPPNIGCKKRQSCSFQNGVIWAKGHDGELHSVRRSLYALRDVTGTTSSLPLIVSSIMSKKLAEGAAALLLDCKTGSGAFCIAPPQLPNVAHKG